MEVFQYTKSGKYLCSWADVESAARNLLIKPGKIRACLDGKKPTGGKYRWSYHLLTKSEMNNGFKKKVDSLVKS